MREKSTVLFLTILCGFIIHLPVFAADAADYQKALKQTQAALTEAAKNAQLWSTSGKLLKQAATAAATGDFDQAVNLVDTARVHGELAVATAEREKSSWQNRVPK